MSDHDSQLSRLIQAVRRRRGLILALRGAALTLGVTAALLLALGWAAYRWRYSGAGLVSLRVVALACVAAAAYFFLIRPLRRRVNDLQVARLIEEKHAGLSDRLSTAVEFSSAEERRRASDSILDRLIEDAGRHAEEVRLDEVVPRKRLFSYGGAAAACVAAFILVLLFGPQQLSTGLSQLVKPVSAATASAHTLAVKVKPGTARVPKGSDPQILATLVNFSAEPVTFFSRKFGTEAQWVGQVMERARNRQDYQFFIFNIQDSVEYFVEANGVKSETFKLTVVDLPYVKQIDTTLNYPSYTGLPPKTTEDSGDVAALKGSVVHITARLTGKVKTAHIVLRDGTKIEMKPQPNEAGEVDYIGSVTVTQETSYHIELVSVEGEEYNGSNEHDISLLEDQPPVVTFEKPGRDVRATSVEEIFTQAKAEDDYGVSSLELYFSVNGSEEKKVVLQNLKRDEPRTLSGAHTFFLEEFNLKPGDFISYYAKARDARSEATSDIYFIEVKPFEREFRQAQQQPGGGGEGEQQNALARRQKDIIAATFRVIREQEKYSGNEKNENYSAVALSQEKLRDDTRQLVERIRSRLGAMAEQQADFTKLLEYLMQALKEMEGAIPELKAQKGSAALPFEQRALQQLLRADAVFREMQVAQQSDGQGSGNQQRAEELADLFELELDKMKNQYETLRREQQQQSQRQQDETSRKLEELARRQQKELEQQQRRAQQARNQQGGGSSRQQQELIDETRKAARELERLSRERRNPQLQEMSRQLEQAANEMQRAQAAQQNNNQQEAIAQQMRALEKLEEARRKLEQARNGQGSQSVQDLRQRAAGAASKQQEIGRQLDEIARRQQQQGGEDQQTRELKQRLAERKEQLANEVSNLERDIDQAARGLGQQQQQAGEQLREAANGLRRNRVSERIRRNNQNIQGNQMEAARAGERMIQQNLNELNNQLQAAEQAARQGARQNSPGGSTEEALDHTRQLADNLESLRRRMKENPRGQQPGQQGQQPGQRNQQGQQQGQPQSQHQSGQQQNSQQAQGQQGQPGQQQARNQQGQQRGQQQGQSQGQQQAQQAQGGQSQSGGQSDAPRGEQQFGPMTGGGLPRGGDRQLGTELRERLREAEELRRDLQREGRGGDLTRQLDQAIQELQRLAAGQYRDDTATAERLKTAVIEPLRQIELELSRRLQAKLGRANLRLADEGAAPERYRRLVDEYYKRLSQRPGEK